MKDTARRETPEGYGSRTSGRAREDGGRAPRFSAGGSSRSGGGRTLERRKVEPPELPLRNQGNGLRLQDAGQDTGGELLPGGIGNDPRRPSGLRIREGARRRAAEVGFPGDGLPVREEGARAGDAPGGFEARADGERPRGARPAGAGRTLVRGRRHQGGQAFARAARERAPKARKSLWGLGND